MPTINIKCHSGHNNGDKPFQCNCSNNCGFCNHIFKRGENGETICAGCGKSLLCDHSNVETINWIIDGEMEMVEYCDFCELFMIYGACSYSLDLLNKVISQ